MKDRQSNMFLGPCATCPLYVFDSGMETQVNMRHCYAYLVEGDRGNIPAGTKSSRNVPASWPIYKKSRCSQSLSCKPQKFIAHVYRGGWHFIWTILREPNEKLFCTSELEN